MQISRVEQSILEVFRSIKTSAPHICATELYCEGWLLRLAMTAWSNGIRCLPFAPAPGSRWFAEPLLYSAFLAEGRGDSLAETHTEADAVVGQFDFGSTKAGVRLTPTADQFIVIEAKVFSKLKEGTTNVPKYDQAARTVACMAEVLRRAGRPIDEYETLGFFVLAPKQQIEAGVFQSQMNAQHLDEAISQRISPYPTPTQQERKRKWREQWVRPLIQRLQLQCVSWENIIERIVAEDKEFGSEFQGFYEDCLRYNGPNRGIPISGQGFSILPV
jgi:hypothetical protein